MEILFLGLVIGLKPDVLMSRVIGMSFALCALVRRLHQPQDLEIIWRGREDL
jgi:hypothetical protein